MTCFPHGNQKITPQRQGFQIQRLPSLWGHFVPITYGLPETHTHTYTPASVNHTAHGLIRPPTAEI